MAMTRDEAAKFIHEAYAAVLGRVPGVAEENGWCDALMACDSPTVILEKFRNSAEFATKAGVKTFFPAGHFHSPVVNPTTVAEYYRREQQTSARDLIGIEVDSEAMIQLYRSWETTIAETKFPVTKTESRRFFLDNGNFPYGDAITLRAIIATMKPRRIIEIGSGNSTACMLDAIDDFGVSETRITCIEPYPDRLKALLRAGDYQTVELIDTPVQEVRTAVFQELRGGDILFIDSTHILKTGSDVHFELFHVLPLLEKGVLIHFHDCQFPFEYPREWIFRDNLSWNEIYAVRAFLIFNNSFKIWFWLSMLLRSSFWQRSEIPPAVLRSPGSGLWMIRVG